MKRMLIGLLVFAISLPTVSAREGPQDRRGSPAQNRTGIHRLEELTWPQIAALDRQRTIFILPIGMLEEHGPHLPIGADTIALMYEAAGVSRRVSRALPDWDIVMMPPVNYGHNGANQLGDMPVHAGTYSIRQSSLRSLVADIGGQVARNGFTWIFVLNGHGAPTHNIAINEACDFVSETYRVTMLHLTALFRADAVIQARGEKIRAAHFSAADLASFGMDLHAGVDETAGMLAVRPDLVRADYRKLPSRAGQTFEELREIATAPGWLGYLSSPARATARYGLAIESWWIDGFTDLVLRAVHGENMFIHPRTPETIPPPLVPILKRQLEEEAAFAATLANWLAQRAGR
jgi:creatinine amidohydrolase